jgi:putative ABC transport system substrate-binding protein
MKRREFFKLIGGGAGFCFWALVAAAEQSTISTIGVLVNDTPGVEQFWQEFREALHDLGYAEGEKVRFEFRSDQGDLSRLPELAAELVQLNVDVIVTWYTPTAIAAKKATRDIPIVCAACGDMLGTGLVDSLARPGGNVTGNSAMSVEIAAKTVELIREIIPSAQRVAVLANAPDPFSKPFLTWIQRAGQATGTEIDPIMIHTSGELDAAFTAMEKSRPEAVIVQPSLPTKRAADLALKYKIPAVCAGPQFAHVGGLVAYFAAEADMYRRAAVFVDKILKGAKAADLPVEQPAKFELVINLKTAKALDLIMPPTLFARAHEVIE